jgi:hypothetical protein
VVLLTKWANDPAKDDHFRAACAGKAAEFTHSRPSRLPERLPLPHEIPEWMIEDFEKRLKEDQARHPERYGLPRPKPKLVVGKKAGPHRIGGLPKCRRRLTSARDKGAFVNKRI